MIDRTKLPVHIESCPIVDALVELRFEANVNSNAVFGLIYGALMKLYPGNVVNLPIMQLPEAVRMSDPTLKFKPLYRIDNKNVLIQIGTDVISISSPLPYIGWEAFKKHVIEIINLIHKDNIIKRVVRFGHRYVNFFASDLLDKITMSFQMTDGYAIQNLIITTQVKDTDFNNTVQFSNNAVLNIGTPNRKDGSIIDIDTFRDYSDEYFLKNIETEIEKAHQCEKTLFFSLLKPAFIDSLNPQY
jgi:uncharacterized protein (TIGR04255 family)